MAQYQIYDTKSGNYVIDDNSSMQEEMQIMKITSQKQRDTLLKENDVVVIDNYTDWCGPCKQCAPEFANLASVYQSYGFCAFAKENAEDKIEGKPVQIRGVPCFHFYMNGVFQDELTVTGADTKEVEKRIQHCLRQMQERTRQKN